MPSRIGEYANIYIIMAHNETVRVNGIMKLWKSCDDQISNRDGFVSLKGDRSNCSKAESQITLRTLRHVNGKVIFLDQLGEPVDVIAMLVRNKNSFHHFH